MTFLWKEGYVEAELQTVALSFITVLDVVSFIL